MREEVGRVLFFFIVGLARGGRGFGGDSGNGSGYLADMAIFEGKDVLGEYAKDFRSTCQEFGGVYYKAITAEGWGDLFEDPYHSPVITDLDYPALAGCPVQAASFLAAAFSS